MLFQNTPSIVVMYILLTLRSSSSDMLEDSISNKNSKLCGKLTSQKLEIDLRDPEIITVLNDETKVVDFNNGTINLFSNDFVSIQVEAGCQVTVCNGTDFSGHCVQKHQKEERKLILGIDIHSVSCSCQKETCPNMGWRKKECGRGYLTGDCHACNPHYIELRMGKNPYFPEKYAALVQSIAVRPGCLLTVYDESEFEGNSVVVDNYTEIANKSYGSYECDCKTSSEETELTPNQFSNNPVQISIPNTSNAVNLLMEGELKNHPGLLAARQSLKAGRSSKITYILVLGTTGSGKSSFINAIFDNLENTSTRNYSTKPEILEYRIPVQVRELGINNSELHIIEIPGLGDTKGLEKEAKVLATFDEYLLNHKELNVKKPNVVLIFHRYDDNRFHGDSSKFGRMLRGLNSFTDRITDKNFSNVIFVLTHFTSEPKDKYRPPNTKLLDFKSVIEEYSNLPKPIVVTVAENKGDDMNLPIINGYYELPNGQFYPKNIFDKIQDLTANAGDSIGDAVIRTAFKTPYDLITTLTSYPLVLSNNTEILKHLERIIIHCGGEITEISQILTNTYEVMDVQLKRRFPSSLYYLQKMLDLRGIRTVKQIPTNMESILEMLSNLKKDEAITFLLQHGLNITLPVLEVIYGAGYSYNVFQDSVLSKSTYKLGRNIISDFGFLIPSSMTATVEKKNVAIFRIVQNQSEYIENRLSDLGFEGHIPLASFNGKTQPGINIKEENKNNCFLTVFKERRLFQLSLNSKLELSEVFNESVKLLTVLNTPDFEKQKLLKTFVKEFGTHVVKSVHYGGSVEIQLRTNNRTCDTEILGAIFEFLQQDHYEDVINTESNKTFSDRGIQAVLIFHGGNTSNAIINATMMPPGLVSKLIKDWEKFLHLKPVVLKTEMQLYPIGSGIKGIGLHFPSEIQRAANLLFNSSLNSKTRRIVEKIPIDRYHLPNSDEKSTFTNLIWRQLSELKQKSLIFRNATRELTQYEESFKLLVNSTEKSNQSRSTEFEVNSTERIRELDLLNLINRYDKKLEEFARNIQIFADSTKFRNCVRL